MTITGYQFDLAKVSATKDSALYNALAFGQDFVLAGQGRGLAVSTSGRTVQVATGMALIQGRLVEVTETETITIPASSVGYLVIEINLSRRNTASGTLAGGESEYTFNNDQVSIKFVSTLGKEPIAAGGMIYHFNLGRVTTSTTTATFTRNQEIDNRAAGDFNVARAIYVAGKPIQQHQMTAHDGEAIRDHTGDFNNNTKSGVYHKSPQAPNCPGTFWGILTVWGAGQNLIQIYAERNNNRRIYTRTRSDGNWSSWREEVKPDHANLVNTGWQTTGMGVPWIKYKKVGDTVILNLTVPANTENRQFGILPAACRPENEMVLNAAKWGTAGAQTGVQIDPSGIIRFLGTGAEKVYTQVSFTI